MSAMVVTSLEELEDALRANPGLLSDPKVRELYRQTVVREIPEVDAAVYFLAEIMGVDVHETHVDGLARALGDEADMGNVEQLDDMLRRATPAQLRRFIQVPGVVSDD